MASFKFRIKDPKAKNPTSIYLEFDDSVHNVKLYIGETLHPKYWDSNKGRANKTYSGYSDYNSKLKKISDGVESLYVKLTSEGLFTAERLKDCFKLFLAEVNGKEISNVYGLNKAIANVTDFVQHYIKSVTKIKGITTIGSYNQTLEVLRGYESQKNRRLTFDGVSIDFYYDFIEYMTDEVYEHEFAVNTKGKHIKNLKAFLNEATEKGLNKNMTFKNKKFQVISEEVDNIYLNETDLARIHNYNFTANEKLDNAKDLFLIGCNTGLRYSDFSQLKTANFKTVEGIDCITIKTQKTGERVTIPVLPMFKEILKKYEGTSLGLPHSISNPKINKYIKDIGRIVGLNENVLLSRGKGKLKTEVTEPTYKLIASHTARRSFATNLFLRGIDSIQIMKITGHRSHKTFMKYIKITGEQNAVLIAKQWEETSKLRIV